jgi:hypothetical protein
MALLKTPITVQVSPSTYRLMMRMIDLAVRYNPATNDLELDPVKAVAIQNAVDNLYDVLGGTNATITAELQQLQRDGLNEASAINQRAGSEIVLTC